MVDVGTALGFVFEDEEWIKKLLLGTVIALIPVFGQMALMGYGVAVIRNVMNGESRPLPDFQNLGQFFMDGLMLTVILLIYAIPLLILACPLLFVGFAPVLAAENEELMAVLGAISGIIGLGCGCLVFLASILLALVVPTIHIKYAQTGEIGACLQFQEIFQFTFANIGPILISMLLLWAANGLLMPLVGGCTLGLLALPAAVWSGFFMAHMYGQIGRHAGVTPAVSQSAV